MACNSAKEKKKEKEKSLHGSSEGIKGISFKIRINEVFGPQKDHWNLTYLLSINMWLSRIEISVLEWAKIHKHDKKGCCLTAISDGEVWAKHPTTL